MKLKALLISILACIMLLSGCATGDADLSAPDGMKLFSNDNVDYTAYVPVNWIVDMSTGTLSAYVSSADASSINITAQILESVTTLEEYWKGYEADFAETFKDMEYVGKAPATTTLDGVAAHKYTYTATVTGNQYKFMQIVCIKDTTVYVITYTSTPDRFDGNMEDVDKILDNFSFKD